MKKLDRDNIYIYIISFEMTVVNQIFFSKHAKGRQFQTWGGGGVQPKNPITHPRTHAGEFMSYV